MASRNCKGCGYHVSGAWYCDRCKRARGKPTTRYGGQHQAKRKAEKDQQWGRPCVRCGWPMHPGQKIQLDHRDDKPDEYLGWSHATCNLRAGGRRGAAVTNGYRGYTPRPPAEGDQPDGIHRPDGTLLRQHARDW
jgi:hypothetical protein